MRQINSENKNKLLSDQLKELEDQSSLISIEADMLTLIVKHNQADSSVHSFDMFSNYS